MRFLALTVIKEIKRRFNDPLGLIMWFMIPLVLGGLLMSVLGGSSGPSPKAQLLLTDLDDTIISQAIPQYREQEAGSVSRIPAQTIEEIVIGQIKALFEKPH